jgi:hypothetical protein
VAAFDWSLPARERKSDADRLAGCLRKVDEVQTNDEQTAYADANRQLTAEQQETMASLAGAAAEKKRKVCPFFYFFNSFLEKWNGGSSEAEVSALGY